jgi:hypothetical protein
MKGLYQNYLKALIGPPGTNKILHRFRTFARVCADGFYLLS